jgi:DNA-binding transcriptional MerR regulator
LQYRSQHVATIYGITIETVNVWAREFSQYFSPTATPGQRKVRLFTQDDMAVIDLIATCRKQQMSYEDIHASLASGQRGDPPDVEPEQVQAIVSTEHETRLALENERLKMALVDAQGSLRKAETELARLRELEDKTIRLESQIEAERASKKELLEQQESQRKELQSQIAALQQDIKELALQTGREYAKGFVEGIKNSREVKE